MSAGIRDLKVTLRLEEALRFMARITNVSCAYTARRFSVDEQDLRDWLQEFNGGVRYLTPQRIDEVKRELGSLTEERPTEHTEDTEKPRAESPEPSAQSPEQETQGGDIPRGIEGVKKEMFEDLARDRKRPPEKARVTGGALMGATESRAGISPKERRHLVASILCGMLANPANAGRSGEDLIAHAWAHYDGLVQIDEQRSELGDKQ